MNDCLKAISGVFLICIFFGACNKTFDGNTDPKYWLGKEVDTLQLKERLNVYQMYNNEGDKVGSMVFAFDLHEKRIIVRDTSQFDDGSIYETAEFVLDRENLRTISNNVDMKTGSMEMQIRLKAEENRVEGFAKVTRGENIIKTDIDSTFQYDVFRSDLYVLLHTIEFSKGDSIPFRAIAPMSGMRVSDASIVYEGEETIQIAGKSYACVVVMLKSDGVIPANKIWISKETPRRIMKFEVTGAGLNIELSSDPY